MKVTLRDYQADALQRVEAAEARGVRRQLGVAATGLGKTIIFCALAERRGGRTLVLAHRDELISQAAGKVLEVWPDAQVGVVKAERDEVRAQVVVASVQTLARPARLARLCAAFTDGGILSASPRFGLVVVDEAHHAAADTYRGILSALHAGEPGGPLLFGVTATPDRGDGKGLDDLFDEITFSRDILWGIRAGYLADLRAKALSVDTLDLGDVRVRRGDYDQGQAGRAMETAQAERYIVAGWLEHALGRRTLVFTPTVETARLVAEEFARCGVVAGYVHGGTPLEERRAMLANYAAGRITVLANCAVLTEGYDEPRTDCIVVARPTKSRALYTQMIGRGTRKHPDKADCLVLDMVGNSDQHSLVTIPSLFGLGDGYAKRMGDGTGLLTDVMAEHDQELVRLGRMRAEDADLFKRMRQQGIAWVAVHREGQPLRRYERSLGTAKDGTRLPTVVLQQREPGDVWTAGLWWPATKTEAEQKRVLMAEVPLELAQGVGEDYARKHGSAVLLAADAPWRARKPSAKALAAAKKWRLPVDPAWSAGELSDALAAHIGRIQARPKKAAR